MTPQRSLVLNALCCVSFLATCADAKTKTFDFNVDKAIVSLPPGTSPSGVRKVCAEHNLQGGQCAILQKAYRGWEATAIITNDDDEQNDELNDELNDDAEQAHAADAEATAAAATDAATGDAEATTAAATGGEAVDQQRVDDQQQQEHCDNEPSSKRSAIPPNPAIAALLVKWWEGTDILTIIALVAGICAWCTYAHNEREKHRLNLRAEVTEARRQRAAVHAHAAGMLSLLTRWVVLADWAFLRCQALAIDVAAAQMAVACRKGVATVVAETRCKMLDEKLDMGCEIPALYVAWQSALRALRKDFHKTVHALEEGLPAVYTNELLREGVIGNIYRKEIEKSRDEFNRVVNDEKHPYQRLRRTLLVVINTGDDLDEIFTPSEWM